MILRQATTVKCGNPKRLKLGATCWTWAILILQDYIALVSSQAQAEQYLLAEQCSQFRLKCNTLAELSVQVLAKVYCLG